MPASVIKLPMLDGLVNLLTGMGTSRDRSLLTKYTYTPHRWDEFEAMYRNDWIARKLIDIPAYDMVRKGRVWKVSGEEASKLEAAERDMKIWDKAREALIYKRLYGGGAIVAYTGGDLSQPIDLRSVKDVLALHVFSSKRLRVKEFEDDLRSARYNSPRMFQLAPMSGTSVDVHPSRVIAFRGESAADSDNIEDWWGDSILEAVYQSVQNASKAAYNFASLVDEAKVDIVSIQNLTDRVSTQAGAEKLSERWSLFSRMKSQHGVGLVDADEVYAQKQLSFAGHDTMMMSFLIQVCAAADIPATRFLGQSPNGLNATGESDLRNYYNSIESRQQVELRPALDVLDKFLVPKAIGSSTDKRWYEFRSLWTPTAKEQAEIDAKKIETVKGWVEAGVILPGALVTGAENLLSESGFFPGFEEALAQAKKDELLYQQAVGELGLDDPSDDGLSEPEPEPEDQEPDEEPEETSIEDGDPDQPRGPKGTEQGGQWIAKTQPLTPVQQVQKQRQSFRANPFYPDDTSLLQSIHEKILIHKRDLDNDHLDHFGLRIDESRELLVGSVAPKSRVWIEGEETSDLLGGTSTVDLGKSPSISNISRGLQNLAGYYGYVLTLVVGHDPLSGEDLNEKILRNAKVLGVWSKKSLSDYNPDQPRGPEGTQEGGQWIAKAQPLTPVQQVQMRRKALATVNYEVAPDPNDLTLAERWRSLTAEERLEVSRDVSKKIVPEFLSAIGAKGIVTDQVGSYLDDTNPSFALALEDGDIVDVAKGLGYALSQDSMMVIGSEPFAGSFGANALVLEIGDKRTGEIESIYNTLRGVRVEGRQVVNGQTTSNGFMTILLDDKDDADKVAFAVDRALESRYVVKQHSLQIAFPTKEDYSSARLQSDSGRNSKALWQGAHRFRGEASALIRQALERKSRGRGQGRDASQVGRVIDDYDPDQPRGPKGTEQGGQWIAKTQPLTPVQQVQERQNALRNPEKRDHKAELLSLVENGASAEEIEANEAFNEVLSKSTAIASTSEKEGYGTPDYFANRVYVIDGEEVVGLRAAQNKMMDHATEFAWTDDGLAPDASAIRFDKQAAVIIGLPASGKSTIANPIAREMGAALVDADEAKKIMPEYQSGIGAAAVHEESSDFMKGVQVRLQAAGTNLVIPKVGDNPNSIRRIINELKKAGYSVSLIHVDVKRDEAMRRMVRRFVRTGRLLSARYMASVAGKPGTTYDILKSEGIANGYMHIDNNGAVPEIVENAGAIVSLRGG